MSPRPSKRSALLQAAATVVAERGYSALTLDAVGEAAGVSKGGVLYHFHTKEELVEALLEQLAGGFEVDLLTAHEADQADPGAWTRAFVRASTSPSTSPASQADTVALLAAVAYDPAALEPVRQKYADWCERLDHDGLPVVDAHVVRLAADGLWAVELFGLAPPNPDLRARIQARLIELASPGEVE